MYKKIYSLLASLILLTACSEEILQDNNNPVVKGEEVTMSFTLDIPSASMLSKSTDIPEVNGEPVVANLKMYAFDGDKKFLKIITPSNVTASEYTATIPLETRVIHFISNYDGDKLTEALLKDKTEDYILSLSTSEYIFWSVKRFPSQPPADLGTISLYRNWAKVSVVNDAAIEGKKILSNVRYFVYRTSQVSSIVQEEVDKINMPSITPFPYGNLPTTGMPATSIEVIDNVDNFAYLFENDNSNSQNATYVIIEAYYDDDRTPSYYKIDFSNNTGDVMELYNILRNKWYQITIMAVAGRGCTFAEVIDPDKVPDNNITASAQLNDYPKISFGGESLEVSGTTFLFTEPAGSMFDMTAIFKDGDIPDVDKLRVVQNKADLENVLVYSDEDPEADALTVTKNFPTPGFVAISGQVKGVQATSQKGHFYVVGGALQRKITIIVQKAYDFINFTLTKADAAVGSDVTAHFELPANIEKSIFPLEVSFETKKLYSAEDGIRIEHVGSNYRYVYTVKEYNEAGYNVSFKTNDKNATEMVYLTAKYFNQAEAQLRSGAPLYNFSDVTVSNPYYGVGEDVTLDISFPGGTQLPVTVYISAPTLDGPTMYTFQQGDGLSKQLKYTTKIADATGEITVSADDYVSQTKQIASQKYVFSDITVSNPYYGIGESVTLDITLPTAAKLPVTVSIAAPTLDGPTTWTFNPGDDLTKQLAYTTNVANATGAITVSSDNYVTETRAITTHMFEFENVTVSNAYYGVGESFQVKFTVPADAKLPVDVTIDAPNMDGTKTITVTDAGVEYAFDLTSNVANSAGNITLSAEGFTSISDSYKCITREAITTNLSSEKITYSRFNRTLTGIPSEVNGNTNASLQSVNNDGKYVAKIAVNVDVNAMVRFSHRGTIGTYTEDVKIADLIEGKAFHLD